MPVIEPKTKEEYEKALLDAKGPVLVEFMQNGCGHCDPEALNNLAKSCASSPTTLMRVEVSEGFGSDVADQLNISGTPTSLLAMTARDFTPEGLEAGRLQEVDPESAAVRRKLKCAVTKKGG